MMETKDLAALQKQEEILHIKKMVVTVCTVLLCFIDQVKSSGYSGTITVAINLTGFAIAPMILLHFHLRDFRKPAHMVWLLLSLLAFYIIPGPVALATDYEKGQWITAALNIWIFGHVAIALFYRYLSIRKVPRVRWIFFGLWIFMMLGMMYSQYGSLWPFWFFSMFGCFYLTDYTEEEKDCVFDGLLSGVIISFFLIQGFGTCYRMYESIRYNGMYTNCNINALFYLMTQAAVLGKWYRFEILDRKPACRAAACAGNGILIAYCALTIGRTALVVMCLNTALFLFLLLFVDKKYRLSKITLRFAGVVLTALFSFPVIFSSVRYVPVHFASPLLLGFESSARNTIADFSADPKRFASMEVFLKTIFNRFDNLDYQELFDIFKIKEQSLQETLFPAMTAKASSSADPEVLSTQTIGSGTSREDPLYSDPGQISPFNIRVDIYKGYYMRLNFSGHRKDDSDLWITKSSHFLHCHNLILQMLYNFGWIPGILFGCIGLITILFYFFKCVLSKDSRRRNLLCCLLFTVSFFFFGMLELDWELGQMPLTFFFISCFFLFQKESAPNEETVPRYEF